MCALTCPRIEEHVRSFGYHGELKICPADIKSVLKTVNAKAYEAMRKSLRKSCADIVQECRGLGCLEVAHSMRIFLEKLCVRPAFWRR
jgi:hypothetical protein